MTFQNEAGIILRGVGKGLVSIVLPSNKVNLPSEYLVMHYCMRCKGYHIAGYDADAFTQRPQKEKRFEYPQTHYCEKCGKAHKAK